MEEYSSRPENQGGYRTRLILLWDENRERKRSLNDQKRGKSLETRRNLGTAAKWSERHRLKRREWARDYERVASGMNEAQLDTKKSESCPQTDHKFESSLGTVGPNTDTFAADFEVPLAAQISPLSTHYNENLTWGMTSGHSYYNQPINPGMEAGLGGMLVAGHPQSDLFGDVTLSDWSLMNPAVSNTDIPTESSINFPNLNNGYDTYANASRIVDMPEQSFGEWQANDVIDFSLLDTQLESEANSAPTEEQQGYTGY
ncbi:hypothetical protein L486_06155 [Kwoniella mangroviensis CBS 10435]|uniref:Uncharacterized protein n=1 Tax=Kwoniella mangroviensis CBS 10435 TaxID=1331196 RepID=A0A1B9ILH1_9TREE|nr:hypothetical protein L486_06155 [Kwoniella mangroviensis CBS 10435]